MLVFGCCAGPTDRFERVAGPSLRRIMAADDVLDLEDGRDGICAAYNRVLARARDLPGCEGVVLLHDDVELRDPQTRDILLAALRGSGVGVVGVVGGRGLHGPQWVDARHQVGTADDVYGRRRFGPAAGDVDVVDGLLLALSPTAVETLSFDEVALPAFHGYDTDLCLSARGAGLRVVVIPLDHRHHDKGSVGDRSAFEVSAAALRAKWPGWIRPLRPWEVPLVRGRDTLRPLLGAARHRAALAVKSRLARR